MRQRSNATFNFGCAFAVLSAAVLAYGITSRPAAQERGPETAADTVRSETVVARADAERNLVAMKLRAAEESAAADRALFIPAPTYLPPGYQQTAAAPRPAPVLAAAVPMPTRRPV
ncbi:MAG: hypothetical protein JOZ17_17950, partial [Acetobacteraceae bacterium]|nr:hypothetical protein [Acetobacteraceae bacterium]